MNGKDSMTEQHSEHERHYRKLLAWYPRDHRDRHGDEMLGVLLAGTGPSHKEPATCCVAR